MNEDVTINDYARQLGHDAKSHLLVVSLGLEVLEASREDADQFAEVLDRIRQDGITPLQQDLRRLIELTQEAE